jgi:hypothetical protein
MVGRYHASCGRAYAPLCAFGTVEDSKETQETKKEKTMNRAMTVLFLLLMAFAYACAACSCATGNSPIAQAIADKLANQNRVAQPEPTEGFKAFYAR